MTTRLFTEIRFSNLIKGYLDLLKLCGSELGSVGFGLFWICSDGKNAHLRHSSVTHPKEILPVLIKNIKYKTIIKELISIWGINFKIHSQKKQQSWGCVWVCSRPDELIERFSTDYPKFSLLRGLRLSVLSLRILLSRDTFLSAYLTTRLCKGDLCVEPVGQNPTIKIFLLALAFHWEIKVYSRVIRQRAVTQVITDLLFTRPQFIRLYLACRLENVKLLLYLPKELNQFNAAYFFDFNILPKHQGFVVFAADPTSYDVLIRNNVAETAVYLSDKCAKRRRTSVVFSNDGLLVCLGIYPKLNSEILYWVKKNFSDMSVYLRYHPLLGHSAFKPPTQWIDVSSHTLIEANRLFAGKHSRLLCVGPHNTFFRKLTIDIEILWVIGSRPGFDELQNLEFQLNTGKVVSLPSGCEITK